MRTDSSSQDGAEQIGFLILPEFPIYALIVAIETLRVANQNSGQKLFSWHLFSVDGRPVKAGNGMTMTPEAAIAAVPYFPTVIVCAGNPPVQYITSRLPNWLRRLDRHGARPGALDTGPFTPAPAGPPHGHHAPPHCGGR